MGISQNESFRVTIEDVVFAFRSSSKPAFQRMGVLRLEIDYELATLFEAKKEGDASACQVSLLRLQELRREAMLFEMWRLT